jgi:hypothetical protein
LGIKEGVKDGLFNLALKLAAPIIFILENNLGKPMAVTIAIIGFTI